MAVAPLVPQACDKDKSAEMLAKAQAIVESNMALKNPGLLTEDFTLCQALRPSLSKAQYLKTYGEYGLETALPDLFWNAHDFRVDQFDASRVWATVRVSGTHRGVLKYGGKDIEPTFRRVEGAPECISFTFDAAGRCSHLTSGLCMDRSVGNTGDVGGIWGVLTAIGAAPSVWDRLPPGRIFSEALGRSLRLGGGMLTTSPLAPALMVGLARQVALAQLEDASSIGELLSDDFVYIEPYVGPLKKKAYLKSVAGTKVAAGVPDLQREFYDFRVDPFEPARVWFTSRATGTNTLPLPLSGTVMPPTNKTFELPPETGSVTFDKKGFITKITAAFVMDPEVGNTEGLGGLSGVLSGIGRPQSSLSTQPLPVAFRRLLSPLTKVQKAVSLPEVPKLSVPTLPKASSVSKPTPKAAPKAEARPIVTAKAPVKPAPKPAPVRISLPPKPAPQKAVPPPPKAVAKPPTSLKVAPKPAPAPPKIAPKPAPAPPKVAPVKVTPPKVAAKPTSTGKPVVAAAVAEPKKAPAASGGLFSMFGSSPKTKTPPAPEPIKTEKAPASVLRRPQPVTSAAASPAVAVAVKTPAVAIAPPPPAPSKAPVSVVFSPELEGLLLSRLGGESAVGAFRRRCENYAKGAISSRDLASTVRNSGLLPVAKDIAQALPSGNARKAFLDIIT